MAIIRYERGSDGVVRESVSNDGGKTYTQTGATSSNGYSGGYKGTGTGGTSSSSTSSGKTSGTSSNKTSSSSSSSSSGGTNYSGYTQAQYDNQSAYLNKLISQGGGNAEWAKTELNKLNSQYSGGSSTTSSSSGTTSNKGTTSSAGSTTSSGGTNYSGYTQDQYTNQSAYLQGLIAQGGGNATWAQSELDKLNSQYGGSTSGYWQENAAGTGGTQYNNTDVGTWDTSSDKWTHVAGTGGVNYAISNDNGTIIVTDSNGFQTRFLPTNADYNQFYGNMMSDIGNAGNSYTPTHNWTTANGTNVTTKNYLLGNSDLKYALEQNMQATGSNTYDIDAYVMSLYNRVGTQRADGTIVTLADVDAELNRLGLSDYNSQNAIYTAGGTLLPGNEFVTTHGDNGQTSNSADSTWASYGGQDYLIGGDSANYVNYVNGKTGNTNNLSMIFGDMANNPYAMQDPEFLAQYNQNLNNFNNTAGITTTNPGSITGNVNVDNVINYVNSMNNYNQATGNGGTVNLLDMIQGYLDNGLEANKGFLDQQRAYAEQQAQQQASDAYVNQIVQGDAMKQQMSAAGMGTSGALQSALLGVQGNYNSNLNSIQNNLNTMLNGLSEQELQILTDYYNNMANYAYDVTKYEQDRAMQNAQLALQQQQAQYDRQYQQQQLALQQQQWEWQQRQAAQQNANSQYQYYNDTQNSQKESQADRYENLHNAGVISGSQLMNALNGLGALGGNNANVSNTGIYNGYTADQYNNQAAYLQNMIATGTQGQRVWAQNELAKLNAQYGR
jgi:hypothetical protein